MDILQTISTNLSHWMETSPGLGTLEEVAAAAGIGYGTVRRIKNGQINPTIKNLELLSKPFKKTVSDLLASTDVPYSVVPQQSRTLKVNQTPSIVLDFQNREAEHPAISEIVELMRRMNEKGKASALKHVRLVADEYSILKANREQ